MSALVMDRVRRVVRGGDSGMTLVELIVAMGIFVVVLVVFLAAVVTMSQTTVRTQVTSDSASQMRTTFQRLDKEVRYASEINMPGMVGDDIYLEYLIPSNTATGDEQCVQWRYDSGDDVLERRTWHPGDPGGVTGWSTMVQGLRNDLTDPAQAPFAVRSAGVAGSKVFLRQRLEVYLDAGLGEDGDGRGSQLDVTFVALNSSVNSETHNGAETVCLGGGVQRP